MSARANQVIEAYLAQCVAPNSRLRAAVTDVDLAAARQGTWRLLPRPLIVDGAEFEAFSIDLARIFTLLTELPKRCFDGDIGRFCAALGIDERRTTLMRRLGDSAPPMSGRSDMYYDGTSFRLLEFNIGSALGGLDLVSAMPEALMRVPAFAEFVAANGLGYYDTGSAVADALRAAGKPVADGDPVIAILEGPGGMATYGKKRHALARLLAEHGLDCRVGEIGDLKSRRGKPHLFGIPVDVVLRYFTLEEMLAHPDGEALMEPVFRAHEDGTAVLWTPMSSQLFSNKGTLAMLSEFAADGSMFSPAERELIERVLPWSRMLGRPCGGAAAGIVEECLERREQLVLKPTGLYGGQGVVIGHEVTDRAWREAVTDGATTGCLIQQEVQPNVEPMIDPETGKRSDWYALWGAYLTPAGLAGGSGRAVPVGGSTMISISANYNTRASCVFRC